MSDQSDPERERLMRVDLPAFPGDEGPVRRAMMPRSYEEEVAMFREGKLAGMPAFDPSPPHVIADRAMLERWRAHRTGLAPYYPLLYSLVIGMGAQRVFEFGVGESSEVLVSALKQTGGKLMSCSPDGPPDEDGLTNPYWRNYKCLSSNMLARLPLQPDEIFDLVLHDGAHSADVVRADLLGIIPRIREGGLILVHDVLHSYVGAAMRSGVAIAVDAGGIVQAVRLPFAFGLEVLQVFNTGNGRNGPVSIGPDKPSSPHHTERMT
jgi:predicted O-methyltransferase YrrM